MPLYDITCECGATECFTKRVVHESVVTCNDCGATVKKDVPKRLNLDTSNWDTAGSAGVNGVYCRQLGRHFRNEAHKKRVLAENGMREVSLSSDTEGRRLKDSIKQKSADMASPWDVDSLEGYNRKRREDAHGFKTRHAEERAATSDRVKKERTALIEKAL